MSLILVFTLLNMKNLIELINKLSSNNVQNEIYITDLISLFNQKDILLAQLVQRTIRCIWDLIINPY